MSVVILNKVLLETNSLMITTFPSFYLDNMNDEIIGIPFSMWKIAGITRNYSAE